MKIEIAFPDDQSPEIPVGALTRIEPIVGESDGETVVAFRLIDDRDGQVLATVPLSQVRIDGRPASEIRVRVEKP